ncbi:DUF4116 domain-containing protein [Roseateles sp. PN1]|uniref:DUF4116 domain-containing protein n=1 Tax=Roseateles sp. PN1 TaxID=3137372 RepID=UPI003138D637
MSEFNNEQIKFFTKSLVDSGKLDSMFKLMSNDKDFIKQSMKSKPGVLAHASAELRDDKQFMTEIFESHSNCGHLLQYASDRLRDDKEFVSKVLEGGGFAFEHASLRLRADKEIGLQAVKHGWWDAVRDFGSQEIKGIVSWKSTDEAINALEDAILTEKRIEAHEKLQSTLSQKGPAPKQKLGMKL